MMRREGWGRGFDADRLAGLELRLWKACYRRQPIGLVALLVLANREQAYGDQDLTRWTTQITFA